MRPAVSLFFLLVVAKAHAITPWIDTKAPRPTVTVDGLYEACSVVGETAHGDIPNFDCESYVYGVLDAYMKVRDAIPKQSRACFPAKIEAWRVLQVAAPKPGTFKKGQTAASFLIDYLKLKYPCS